MVQSAIPRRAPEIDIVSALYTTGQDIGNAGRGKHARPAVALLFCLIASTAAAQGSPAPAPAPSVTPVSTPAPAAAPAPAGDLVRTNPAAPQPNPNLASTGAVPGRRGFYRAEPFDIYPFLGVGLGWTDNLLGQATNPVSSSLLVVSPRVQAETRTGAHVHSLRYGGSYGHYASSSADDFAVHEFVASTVNQFSARTDLSANAYYLQQQDPRGLSVRAILAEPDRWQGYGANVRAGYGAISAQGRLEGDLGFTSKTYSNNREVTARLDVSTVDGAGRFFYRLTPRIRALTELRMTAFDYDSASLDNLETRMLVGATWDISATSIGTAKVGYVRKNFDDARLQDYGAFAVDAAFRYLPRTYSFIDVAVSRLPSDSFGTGFFTVDTWLAASWTHRWTSYVSTRATLNRLGQDFQGVARQDTTLGAGLAAYFDARTWLRFGVELSRQDRSSNDANFEYTRNQLLFSVGATL